MAKYIKKPIPVEAVQMEEDFEVITLEGVMKGHSGDYLCTDHRGNKYPCYKLVFEEIYDLIEENPDKKIEIIASVDEF